MGFLTDFCQVSLVVFLGLASCVGMLALVSPRVFVATASLGNREVVKGPTHKRWDAIDRFAVANARPFGMCVVGTVGFIWLISKQGPEEYSKWLFLVIVAVSLITGVVSLTHIMKQSREITERLAEAQTDPLTGLNNRRVLEVELARRVAQRQHQGTPASLLIMDIDKFKLFNDEFGHQLGDEILKEVAKTLKATAKPEDTVARIGGDEFVVLLPGSDLMAASQTAQRVRSAISDNPIRFANHDHSLTVSIGLTEALLDDDTTALFKRADSALYAAKEAGRNCCFRHGGPEPADLTIVCESV